MVPVDTESPSPSPTAIDPEYSNSSTCDPSFDDLLSEVQGNYMPVWTLPRGDWHYENYIRWSTDGSRILFDVSEYIFEGVVDLYSVAADGSRMEKIVDASALVELYTYTDHGIRLTKNVDVSYMELPWLIGSSMTYFDISPDSSQIAFSACSHHGDPEVSRGPKVEDINLRRGPYPRGWVFNYNIALANIDGTEARMLTEAPAAENFPMWSPDGSHVVYISFNDQGGNRGRLTIHTLATGETRDIDLSIGDVVAPHPPAWSPDGQRLAFVVHERELRQSRAAVYTVGEDGSDLTRITDAASGPAWSPDGKRIVVAVPRGPNKASLYTFAADGSRPMPISPSLPDPWEYPLDPWMGNLSWSPDGSAILFEGFALAVDVHGSGTLFDGFASLLMHLEGLPYFSGWPPEEITSVLKEFLEFVHMFAAWSPDGSKIAIRTEGFFDDWEQPLIQVYVVDRDGSNPRVLVEGVGSDDGLELRLAQ